LLGHIQPIAIDAASGFLFAPEAGPRLGVVYR